MRCRKWRIKNLKAIAEELPVEEPEGIKQELMLELLKRGVWEKWQGISRVTNGSSLARGKIKLWLARTLYNRGDLSGFVAQHKLLIFQIVPLYQLGSLSHHR